MVVGNRWELEMVSKYTIYLDTIRIKAGSQYDAGASVTSVYVFLRNANNTGIELESILVLRCVLYAMLE